MSREELESKIDALHTKLDVLNESDWLPVAIERSKLQKELSEVIKQYINFQ